MEMISSPDLRGRPWPELMPDHRPVLVLPAAPGRLLDLEDGWSDRDTVPTLTAGPRSDWSAVLAGARLTIHRPGGLTWFDCEIEATREWIRAVHAHRNLLLITGPFTSVFNFQAAATAGQLFLLTTPIRLAGGA